MDDSICHVLRLYPAIWTRIFHFLEGFTVVLKLLSTGNARLRATLQRSVEVAKFDHLTPILDIGPFQRSCQGIHSLKEIEICTHHSFMAMRPPSEPFYLPPTLTSLALAFFDAFALISPLKLSSMTPALLYLKISGLEGSAFALDDWDLPPQLRTLIIKPQQLGANLSPRFMNSLPITLERLSLRCRWSRNSFIDFATASPTPPSWPPSLTSLSLSNAISTCLECLPRTVTKLKLDHLGTSSFNTNFPQGKDAFSPLVVRIQKGTSDLASIVFPWRRFFPHLTIISLPTTLMNQVLDERLLLPTLLLHDAFTPKTVRDWIVSIGLDLPSLARFLDPSYTSFPSIKSLKARLKGREKKISEEDWIEQFQLLAPYLQETDFLEYDGSFKAACFLPALSSVTEYGFVGSTMELIIPSSLKELNYPNARIALSKLPQGLKSLMCMQVLGSGAQGSIDQSRDSFPPGLTSLNLDAAQHQIVFDMLPVVLVELSVQMESHDQWRTIAERLVSLRVLRVDLRCFWECPNPSVAKIASRHLKTFELLSGGDEYEDELWDFTRGTKPWMSEFFSTPSVFPPSLRSLVLSTGYWHASILAILPPTLTKLDISEFCWNDLQGENQIRTYPHPERKVMTPGDLIQSLPRGLIHLGLRAHYDSREKPKLADCIKYLPPSLRSLRKNSHTFDTSTSSPELDKIGYLFA